MEVKENTTPNLKRNHVDKEVDITEEDEVAEDVEEVTGIQILGTGGALEAAMVVVVAWRLNQQTLQLEADPDQHPQAGFNRLMGEGFKLDLNLKTRSIRIFLGHLLALFRLFLKTI